MKNMPNKIFLQVGDECPDDADFKELDDVTWSDKKMFENDTPYVREEKAIRAFERMCYFSYSCEHDCNSCGAVENFKKLISNEQQ